MNHLKIYLLSALSVFSPIVPIINTLVTLTVVDLVLGLLVARKRKVKWQSRKFWRTPVKMTLATVVICCSYLVETYIAPGMLPLVKIAAGILGIAELKSIVENTDRLNGAPIFKALVEKLNHHESDKEETRD